MRNENKKVRKSSLHSTHLDYKLSETEGGAATVNGWGFTCLAWKLTDQWAMCVWTHVCRRCSWLLLLSEFLDSEWSSSGRISDIPGACQLHLGDSRRIRQHVSLGTKYREPNTEPKLPKPKYSVPISVPSFQEPNYRGKYRNRTEFTECTEFTWNVISLRVVILLIVLL